MKRMTSILLILALLPALVGCSPKAEPPQSPVTFYYPADDTIYDGKTAVIHQEIRDAAGYEEDIEGLLNLYLKGPASESLRSPFPRQVKVTRYSTNSNTINLVLSSEFAQLSGIDLTLACACLANTLFELTQLERVQFFATDSQLDGQDSITLDRNDIYLADTLPAGTAISEPSNAPNN